MKRSLSSVVLDGVTSIKCSTSADYGRLFEEMYMLNKAG